MLWSQASLGAFTTRKLKLLSPIILRLWLPTKRNLGHDRMDRLLRKKIVGLGPDKMYWLESRKVYKLCIFPPKKLYAPHFRDNVEAHENEEKLHAFYTQVYNSIFFNEKKEPYTLTVHFTNFNLIISHLSGP